jgi:hypothetical protein
MKAWVKTYTNRDVDLFDFKPEDVDIIDIAHHLACINRFNGMLRLPINVAQHSVMVARLCGDAGQPPSVQLQGLLHDAAEAYVGDITKWFKSRPEMSIYRDIEDYISEIILKKFGCEPELHDAVKEADKLMVRFEAGYLGNSCGGWKIQHDDYHELTHDDYHRVGYWEPLSWQTSEHLFLSHFRGLSL